MGEQRVSEELDEQLFREFMGALLDDVRALDRMLETDLIESGVRRIGAEQEMFLVTPACRPAPIALEVLERLGDGRFATELGRFNLEANLSPQQLTGDCLRRIEEEAEELVSRARAAAGEMGGSVLLTGILPTIRQSDLGLDNMIPEPRYLQLNRAMSRLRGEDFHILLKGVDEVDIKHDNVMLEACNTSFQVHFQVGAREFARLYNVAQAVTAPVLAAAVNSPVLLGHRLWQETRVAVFQHSVDARSKLHTARGVRPRVHFGDDWVERSVIEIFRQDIARFRILLTTDIEENSLELVEKGIVPQLPALRLHNSTVYRWNRACYGVQDGRAHLRIENRVLPAGPTVLDEVANAAFFFGLMSECTHEYDDIRKHMSFDDAKSNFLAAARHGLKAQLSWVDGKSVPAADLILKMLLPLAHAGLERAAIDPNDIARYLGLIEQRVASGRTGARWQLASLAEFGCEGTKDERFRSLTAAMLERQASGEPVHTWELAGEHEFAHWHESFRTIGQFMKTELFTVRPTDLVDLAAAMMDWEHIRHVPVENDSGQLVGLVTHRQLLRLVGRGIQKGEPVLVEAVMQKNPVTATPETKTLEALRTMRESKVACLPVVENDKLVGIVTEKDFLDAAAKLFEKELKEV